MVPELSVVIPVRNEAPNVDPLYRELVEVLEPSGRTFEIVIVDDGSTDDTFARLATDRRLRLPRASPTREAASS
jgi:glycosyltransferase involved in cell wall biosynthesis